MAKKLLLSALALIALSFLIFKVELPKEEWERKSELFLKGVTLDEIRSVTIERAKKSFTLSNPEPEKGSRKDDVVDWKVEGVPDGKADEGAVSGLVRSLVDLKLGEPLPKEDIDKDLSVYGLAEPAVDIKVEALEGKEELQFGSLNNYLNKRFARTSDGEIYLVSDSLFLSADKDRDEFRDKNPVKFDTTNVKLFSMSGDGKSWSVRKKDEGSWDLQHPITAEADGSKIAELLRKARSLRVKRFVDDGATKLDEYGLVTPEVTLSLELEKDKKIALSLSSQKDGEGSMYMTVNQGPVVYEVEGNIINSFTQSYDQLRLRKLYSFDPDAVQSFKLTQPAGEIQATKEGGAWKLNDKEGDPHFIEEYLKTVSELEAASFPSGSESISFDAPVVTLEVKEGSTTRTLVVAEQTQRQGATLYPAMVKEGGDTFFLSEQDYKKLLKKEEVLKKVEAKEAK